MDNLTLLTKLNCTVTLADGVTLENGNGPPSVCVNRTQVPLPTEFIKFLPYIQDGKRFA